MKKWVAAILLACLVPLAAWGQEYPELGAKLDQYFTALAGESAAVQNAECDFLISSCQDSLVQQFVALKIYDHYLHSRIMGDDAVAVHVAQEWFLSGKVAMHGDDDLLNAKVFVEFNKHSLVGMQAPQVTLFAPDGSSQRIPALAGGYAALFFYDTGCATCKKETPQLLELAGAHPSLTVYAIYVGSSREEWDAWRAGKSQFVHLWDPSMQSNWQQLYGVLQTPQLLLVSPTREILGRGLDTPALRMLLERETGASHYTYGEEGQMERYAQLFAVYADTLKVSHVLEVADYLAARTASEGNMDAFKQVQGDLLYYLSSQKTEVYRDAIAPFVQRYILMPDVWTSEEDQLQVVALGNFLMELTSRTPVGSQVPDFTVPGVLRRRPCLFARDGKSGLYRLRKLGGQPAYLVFYTAGCSSCQSTLEAIERVLSAHPRARVLLIDMDALMSNQPELSRQLLDSFDLSALPFTLEVDKKGVVLHRYVQL